MFLSLTMFFTLIIFCCIRTENDIDFSSGVDTPDKAVPPVYDAHVFHHGEMRGVWVPYFNLSNGSSHMTESEFHSHFNSIVQSAKDNGLNTIFVHVRSHCDAVYPSDIFPFSDIFTGGSYTPPDYDPLEYMINTAHEAGLEFHAWINPFRVISDLDKKSLGENSPCYQWLHDDITENDRNVIEYEGGLYLNPSKAEARGLIIDGVRELVSRYNVDGVHLDDYFYMFTDSGYDDEDYSQYAEITGENALSLMQWRCNNINILISGLYAVVKNADNDMLFGISPQGNMENDLKIGADVYSWCSRYGYVDYIAPQIYFNSDNPELPYEQTVEDWKNIITNDKIKLYIGLALYKAGSDDDEGTWLLRNDIISNQIEYTRSANTDGFVLYSWEYLDNEQTAAEMDNIENIL